MATSEIIKKMLPEALGAELREHLEDAKKTKRLLKVERDTVKSLHDENEDLKKKNKKLGDESFRYYNAEAKEKELLKRENDLELTLANKEIEFLKKCNDNTLELSRLMFRNPVVKNSGFRGVGTGGSRDCIGYGTTAGEEMTQETT